VYWWMTAESFSLEPDSEKLFRPLTQATWGALDGGLATSLEGAKEKGASSRTFDGAAARSLNVSIALTFARWMNCYLNCEPHLI